MINANELRIGNWVYKTEFGSDKEEKRLYIIKYPHIDFTFTKAYFPIHLTPEILVKAGFSQNMTETGWWQPDEKILIAQDADNFYLGEWAGSSEEPEIEKRIQITSLSQLQNVFYFLTGEELDIKM